jgi:hypothetical protein
MRNLAAVHTTLPYMGDPNTHRHAQHKPATVFADLQILSRQYLQRDSVCNDTGTFGDDERVQSVEHLLLDSRQYMCIIKHVE